MRCSRAAQKRLACSPWLNAWEAARQPVADQRLVEAVTHWADDLLEDQLPWNTLHEAEAKQAELAAWPFGHAPARLRAEAAPELLHRIRLLGLSGPARWDDPHWPG